MNPVSLDPATGDVWRRWTSTSDADIAAAVQRARAAQPEWAARSLGARRRVLAARTVVPGNIALWRKRVDDHARGEGSSGPLVRARLQFAP